MQRRSGLYILGIQGTGKTNLLKSLILQDIANGHGVFFLDPHGDAIESRTLKVRGGIISQANRYLGGFCSSQEIFPPQIIQVLLEDLLRQIPAHRKDDVIVVDPADETHTFGINLLACHNPNSLTERNRSYGQAIDIFTKLFADPHRDELDILLSQYLPNSFLPLIANQGYTLCEVPLLLRNKQARDRLLQHPVIAKDNHEVVDFWHDEFDQLPSNDQREEIASTRRRLNRFLTYEYTKHIIGQTQTTLNFPRIMDTGKRDRLTEPNLRLTLLTFCSMLSHDSKYLSPRCFPAT